MNVNANSFEDLAFHQHPVGGACSLTGKYGMNRVVIQAYHHSRQRNFRNELEFFVLSKPRNPSIIEPFSFGVLKVEEVLLSTASIVHGLAAGLSYLHLCHGGSISKFSVFHRCFGPDCYYISLEKGLPWCKITNFQYAIIIDGDNDKLPLSKDVKNPVEECENFIYYASPESLFMKNTSFDRSDLSSDIYSLGCLIWLHYSVAHEIIAQRSKFGHVFEKRFLNMHPIHMPSEERVSIKKVYRALANSHKFLKKCANVPDKYTKISIECSSFAKEVRPNAKTVKDYLKGCFESMKENFKRDMSDNYVIY
ncbi:hypothetical protein RF11_06702 [Thelohanellus kitauei]|uniref:Protein kinase domain-containing protein n=1 Tax=Thelohanellus kitauei TaxID=669202 RepID=A0A0C2J9M5_THEKT|nr:hypothetical protein RF11_06702 [Thelohanellus kitauei]